MSQAKNIFFPLVVDIVIVAVFIVLTSIANVYNFPILFTYILTAIVLVYFTLKLAGVVFMWGREK